MEFLISVCTLNRIYTKKRNSVCELFNLLLAYEKRHLFGGFSNLDNLKYNLHLIYNIIFVQLNRNSSKVRNLQKMASKSNQIGAAIHDLCAIDHESDVRNDEVDGSLFSGNIWKLPRSRMRQSPGINDGIGLVFKIHLDPCRMQHFPGMAFRRHCFRFHFSSCPTYPSSKLLHSLLHPTLPT